MKRGRREKEQEGRASSNKYTYKLEKLFKIINNTYALCKNELQDTVKETSKYEKQNGKKAERDLLSFILSNNPFGDCELSNLNIYTTTVCIVWI